MFEVDPNAEIIKAIIGALATIAVAGLGLWGVMAQAHRPSKTKLPAGEVKGDLTPSFSGSQNEFMALVIRDNENLRKEQETIRQEQEAQRRAMKGLKDQHESVMDAIRRYLAKIASRWTSSETFPWPDEEDMHILEQTLPHRGRRRTPTGPVSTDT